MLIDTPAGVLNTAHIASVKAERSDAWEERCIVTFADGRAETIPCTIDLFERACGVVVSAQPGFTLIKAMLPGSSKEDVAYVEEPVIAFRVSGAADVMPITISGEVDPVAEGHCWCVRQPSGLCFGPNVTNEDEAAFRAMCDRMAAEEREAARG